MKRIVCIIFVALFFLQSHAQTVVPFGQRVQEYYYWDTVWYDYLLTDSLDDSSAYPYKMLYNYDGDDRMAKFYGRYFWTDVPLNVIGVAAPVKCDDTLHSEHTSYSDRLPEYFRLYDARDSGYILMDEARWEDTLRYRMCLRHYDGSDTFDVREGYFKGPVTVTDSFYVGGTTWNSHQRMYGDFPGILYHQYAPTYYLFPTPWPVGSNLNHYYANASPIMWKYVSPLLYSDMPNVTLYDTTVWTHITVNVPFMAIFPIFELIEPVDTCAVPLSFRVVNQDSTGVTLAWTSADTAQWELAYGAVGADLDSGVIVPCNVNFVTLEGLDTGCYVARVRTVCNDTLRSEWSDTVHFCIVGDTVPGGGEVDPPDSTGIASVVDRYTVLAPNPAHDYVTIWSSFKINRIQVFATSGVLVGDQRVQGVAASVNTSIYPRGTYIVRIFTSAGTVVRRLVID